MDKEAGYEDESGDNCGVCRCGAGGCGAGGLFWGVVGVGGGVGHS